MRDFLVKELSCDA